MRGARGRGDAGPRWGLTLLRRRPAARREGVWRRLLERSASCLPRGPTTSTTSSSNSSASTPSPTPTERASRPSLAAPPAAPALPARALAAPPRPRSPARAVRCSSRRFLLVDLADRPPRSQSERTGRRDRRLRSSTSYGTSSLNARGVASVGGGEWSPQTLRRMLGSARISGQREQQGRGRRQG